MKIKYRLEVIITILVLCSLLSACTRSYKVYDFVSKDNEFPWGVVGAKLIGKKKIINNTAIISSPYELYLWFGSNTFLEGTIHISNLKLFHSGTKTVVFEKYDIPEESIKEYDSLYRAYFSLKNIELEYLDMVLLIKFTLRDEKNSKEYNSEIHFERNFKEFTRIIGV